MLPGSGQERLNRTDQPGLQIQLVEVFQYILRRADIPVIFRKHQMASRRTEHRPYDSVRLLQCRHHEFPLFIPEVFTYVNNDFNSTHLLSGYIPYSVAHITPRNIASTYP